jgi:hypothetical protein
MPSGRDSFRRNRVAPSALIIPPACTDGLGLPDARGLDRVNSRQFTVNSFRQRPPSLCKPRFAHCATLSRGKMGSQYRNWKMCPRHAGEPSRSKDSWLEAGPIDTLLEQLVNHNGDPPPCFLKSVDSKGTLSSFRKNTFKSVDSAWFMGALSLGHPPCWFDLWVGESLRVRSNGVCKIRDSSPGLLGIGRGLSRLTVPGC